MEEANWQTYSEVTSGRKQFKGENTWANIQVKAFSIQLSAFSIKWSDQSCTGRIVLRWGSQIFYPETDPKNFRSSHLVNGRGFESIEAAILYFRQTDVLVKFIKYHKRSQFSDSTYQYVVFLFVRPTKTFYQKSRRGQETQNLFSHDQLHVFIQDMRRRNLRYYWKDLSGQKDLDESGMRI